MKEEAEKGVEREPLANSGLAGALKVASQKGYIEKDVKKSVNVDQKHKERIRNCVFFYNKSLAKSQYFLSRPFKLLTLCSTLLG